MLTRGARRKQMLLALGPGSRCARPGQEPITRDRFLPALQRQRLVAQHPVDDHLARGVEIDAVAFVLDAG